MSDQTRVRLHGDHARLKFCDHDEHYRIQREPPELRIFDFEHPKPMLIRRWQCRLCGDRYSTLEDTALPDASGFRADNTVGT